MSMKQACDTILKSGVSDGKVPGVTAAVTDREGTVYEAGCGERDLLVTTHQAAFVFKLSKETPVSFSETSQSRRASSSFFAAVVVPTFMGYPRIS